MDLRELGPVGAKYIAALANPFDAPAGVQLPADVLSLPSFKVKKIVRYIVPFTYDDAGGNASVCWNLFPANDGLGIYVFNDNTIDANIAAGTPRFLNGPGATGANDAVFARVCGAGLRVSINGPEIQRYSCRAFESSTHIDNWGVSGTYNGTLTNSPNRGFDMNSQNYGEVFWSGPKNVNELSFRRLNILDWLGPGDESAFALAVSFRCGDANFGVPGDGLAGSKGALTMLTIEAVLHVEYIGRIVNASATTCPTPYDYIIPSAIGAAVLAGGAALARASVKDGQVGAAVSGALTAVGAAVAPAARVVLDACLVGGAAFATSPAGLYVANEVLSRVTGSRSLNDEQTEVMGAMIFNATELAVQRVVRAAQNAARENARLSVFDAAGILASIANRLGLHSPLEGATFAENALRNAGVNRDADVDAVVQAFMRMFQYVPRFI